MSGIYEEIYNLIDAEWDAEYWRLFEEIDAECAECAECFDCDEQCELFAA